MNVDYLKENYGAEFISSRANNTIVALSKLSDKKYRDDARLFLSEGTKLSEEALLHSEVVRLILCETALNDCKNVSLLNAATKKAIPILITSESVFSKISSEKSPQGIIAVSRYMERHASKESIDFSSWQKGKRILLLDNIQDPGNLGTIVRSATAMGFYGIVTINCADIYNPKTLRASMGAIFRCNIYQSCSPVEDIKILKNHNRRVLASALKGQFLDLGKCELLESDCIVVGNEGHGVAENILSVCDAALKIPMADGSESLNAAAAAAIIMWEYYRIFQ